MSTPTAPSPGQQPYTVAVTGAAGFVGRTVVRELLGRGWHVRALVRDAAKAARALPLDPKLHLVVGHALDGQSPSEVVRGANACVHLIGIIREVRQPASLGGAQTFRRVHVDATSALLRAAREAGVPRFVHMSALGVTPDGRAEYQRTKFEAEQLVRRSGLDWTILRPGMIHGSDGEFVQMVRDFCSGGKPPFFFIPYFTRFVEHDEGVILGRVGFEAARVAPVHVSDVARAFAEALRRPQTSGEVYNLAGPEVVSWKEMMEFFRDTLPGADAKLPVVGLPGTPHALMARAAGWVGMGQVFPFDEGQAFMAQEDSTADMAKFEAHFGFAPQPFRELVERYAPTMA